MEFLSTLQITNTGVTFRMFNKNFACTWTYMSGLLGFPETCHVDIDNALNDFDRNRLWKDISGLVFYDKVVTDEIHDPTLRFIHKWMAFTLFPREETRVIRLEEFKLIHAMIKRLRVSLVSLWFYIGSLSLV